MARRRLGVGGEPALLLADALDLSRSRIGLLICLEQVERSAERRRHRVSSRPRWRSRLARPIVRRSLLRSASWSVEAVRAALRPFSASRLGAEPVGRIGGEPASNSTATGGGTAARRDRRLGCRSDSPPLDLGNRAWGVLVDLGICSLGAGAAAAVRRLGGRPRLRCRRFLIAPSSPDRRAGVTAVSPASIAPATCRGHREMLRGGGDINWRHWRRHALPERRLRRSRRPARAWMRPKRCHHRAPDPSRSAVGDEIGDQASGPRHGGDVWPS